MFPQDDGLQTLAGARDGAVVPARDSAALPDARRRALLGGAALGLAAALSGCGFRRRGTAELPFGTLYLAVPDGSALGAELRRNLVHGSNVTIVNEPGQAEARLDLLGENRRREIVSYNAAGRAREYRLYYSASYRVSDGKGRDFVPVSELTLKRDTTNIEDQILAQESQEAFLYRDMQTDMAQQIVRRLALIKR
ncbi:LPS assembly lipoprotein LptE [Derxia gummosa]|uniref:LPS-assembly lipoprotein LptE n=1 Tax=Derxia gummosa DSM 723 TaxID=1121388 RepID=A0A9U5G6I0_9BURK|nr:LPS assembly lipoprotein LptE [Derxia gummosa]